MDIRTGRTYASKDDALAAGVPESDIAEIKTTREGPNPRAAFAFWVAFKLSIKRC